MLHLHKAHRTKLSCRVQQRVSVDDEWLSIFSVAWTVLQDVFIIFESFPVDQANSLKEQSTFWEG